MANPSREHWTAALHVLQYLYHTRRVGLTLGGELKIAGYSDADWVGDHDDRKSTGSYIFKIGVGAIAWQSKKQSIVALSSTEAEYMALTQATKQAIWLCQFIEELGAELNPIVIFGDNQGSMALTRNDAFHQCTKHINVQWHFVREAIPAGLVELHYCKGTGPLWYVPATDFLCWLVCTSCRLSCMGVYWLVHTSVGGKHRTMW